MAIEETKQDLKERALIKKRAGQNERQKKHWAKMVEKEIVKGIRDDDGEVRKKQKVSEAGKQLSCAVANDLSPSLTDGSCKAEAC